MTERFLALLLLGCLLSACGADGDDAPEQAPNLVADAPLDMPAATSPKAGAEGTLSAAEMAITAPPANAPNAVRSVEPPDGPALSLYSESAYQTDSDSWMIDVIVGTPAYITAQLTDAAGEPVAGKTVSVKTSRDSPLMTLASSETDEIGEVTFGVRPNQDGEEIVTVTAGDQSAEITLNVIADQARQWQGMDAIDGVVRWETLLGSRVRYRQDYSLDVTFSETVQAMEGESVQLVGFMLPLESMDKQSHFLLVSTPPSCFFHVPGGPAGAVEVFAERSIEMQWEPIMVTGTFHLVEEEGAGLIYRLQDARLKAMPKR